MHVADTTLVAESSTLMIRSVRVQVFRGTHLSSLRLVVPNLTLSIRRARIQLPSLTSATLCVKDFSLPCTSLSYQLNGRAVAVIITLKNTLNRVAEVEIQLLSRELRFASYTWHVAAKSFRTKLPSILKKACARFER